MSRAETPTVVLLRRWHSGDASALHDLLARDLPWIRERVGQRLGPLLSRVGETDDYVQDAMVNVLEYGPRFTLSDRAAFRGLLVRLIENVLRDRIDYHSAKRRSHERVRSLHGDTVLDLDPPQDPGKRPSVVAQQNEEIAWLRLGIDLLEPDDRTVVLMRQWDGLSFDEIGAHFGVTDGAARMRFHRALHRLAERLGRLRRGDLRDLATA